MIGIRLEKETIAKLDQAAAKWGMTRSAAAESLIEMALTTKGKIKCK